MPTAGGTASGPIAPVAVVTGAAVGIGRAIARRLAAAGYRLALTAEVPLDDAVAELLGLGADVIAVAADFRDPATAAAVVEQAASHFGRLDVLVNNAGLTGGGRLADTPAEMLDTVLAINLKAPWLATQAAAPHLRAAGGGSIVNISSIHAGHGLPGNSAYGASKGGLEAMTRQLAVELAPDRIRVNAVAPGVVEVERYHDAGWYDREVGNSLVPWPRVGVPDDVAAVVAFLADPASEFVTGQVIGVDGGMAAKLALDLPDRARP